MTNYEQTHRVSAGLRNLPRDINKLVVGLVSTIETDIETISGLPVYFADMPSGHPINGGTPVDVEIFPIFSRHVDCCMRYYAEGYSDIETNLRTKQDAKK